MTDKPKPEAKPDVPVGYVVQDVRKRQMRPLHSRRRAILEQAEAAFKPKPDTGKFDHVW